MHTRNPGFERAFLLKAQETIEGVKIFRNGLLIGRTIIQ